MAPSEARIFRSIDHPGATPWPLVFGRALAVPLAVCNIPVMLGGLAAVLQKVPVLPAIFYAFGLAILIAFAWTGMRLRSTLAEITVAETAVRLRTIWECSFQRREDTPWHPLLDLRKTRQTIILAAGDRMYETPDDRWPDLPELLAALRRARSYQREHPF